jgi:tetratricopeptide (TPR) repeat protein
MSSDIYRSVKIAYEKGDWDAAIKGWQEVIRVEPEAADAYYYIGEAYRFKGNPSSAIDAYQRALQINPSFGPAYVGLARARLMMDPNADVLSFLDEAIRLDPNFGEAISRHGERRDVIPALWVAWVKRLPPAHSPLLFYYLAGAQEGDLELALIAAGVPTNWM